MEKKKKEKKKKEKEKKGGKKGLPTLKNKNDKTSSQQHNTI